MTAINRDALRYDALEVSLTNWTPGEGAVRKIEEVRGVAKVLGAGIIAQAPDSRERSLALTHLEETVMWAVKAIVLDDRNQALVREGLQAQMDEQ